jgi:hypothetical protein
MSRSEKEYDAYRQTEEWTIKRGLPTQYPDFRMSEPMPGGMLGPGPPVVNELAIKQRVDEWYPFSPPSTLGGPTPPQVVGRTPDGTQVVVEDHLGNQSLRQVKEGDTFPADKPRNPTNRKQISPSDFKCS